MFRGLPRHGMSLFCRPTKSSDSGEAQVFDLEVFRYLGGVVALKAAPLDGA